MRYILLFALAIQTAAFADTDSSTLADSLDSQTEALSFGCDQPADEHCVESSTKIIIWKDDYINTDINMDKECKDRMERGEVDGGPNLPAKEDTTKEVIDYGLSHYRQLDRACTRRDVFKKCQFWKYRSEYRCFLKYRDVN